MTETDIYKGPCGLHLLQPYIEDIVKEFENFRQTGTWTIQRKCKDETLHYEGEVIYPVVRYVRKNEFEFLASDFKYEGLEITKHHQPYQLTSQFLVTVVIPDARHGVVHKWLWSWLKNFMAGFLPSLEEKARNSFYAIMVNGEAVPKDVVRNTYTLRIKPG